MIDYKKISHLMEIIRQLPDKHPARREWQNFDSDFFALVESAQNAVNKDGQGASIIDLRCTLEELSVLNDDSEAVKGRKGQ